MQPGFPQRGTYSCFSQRRGSQTLGSSTERRINERGKRNTAGSHVSLLFDLVIQSYKVIVNTVISVFWVGVKHSFKDILKAVIGSLFAVDFSNRAELTFQHCITEGDQVYLISKKAGTNRWQHCPPSASGEEKYSSGFFSLLVLTFFSYPAFN